MSRRSTRRASLCASSSGSTSEGGTAWSLDIGISPQKWRLNHLTRPRRPPIKGEDCPPGDQCLSVGLDVWRELFIVRAFGPLYKFLRTLMSDVQFQQAHNLGLPKARELAQRWADGAAAKMGLTCKHQEGAEQDVIAFERSGVNGTMTVTANSFDVNIKLGLMMKAFKPMIEAELAKNVSRMVEKGAGSAQA